MIKLLPVEEPLFSNRLSHYRGTWNERLSRTQALYDDYWRSSSASKNLDIIIHKFGMKKISASWKSANWKLETSFEGDSHLICRVPLQDEYELAKTQHGPIAPQHRVDAEIEGGFLVVRFSLSSDLASFTLEIIEAALEPVKNAFEMQASLLNNEVDKLVTWLMEENRRRSAIISKKTQAMSETLRKLNAKK